MVLGGALIMAVTVALSPPPILGEGGARRDAVRQAAESAAAENAAPSSLSKHATILNRDGQVVRIGSNGWMCLPDDPGTEGTDSICMNEPWRNFMEALKNKKKPTYTQVGIAYMLQGDRSVLVARGASRLRVTTTTGLAGAAARVLDTLGLDEVAVDGLQVDALLGDVAPERVSAALVAAGVDLVGFEVRHPSLEEIFVELTGEGFDVAR